MWDTAVARRAARRDWCAGSGRSVVVGVGGYASLPALVAARLLRHPGRRARAERRTPGWPTASRCASAPAPRSPARAPRCAGAVVTGNPVRPGDRRRCGGPRSTPPLVAVVGGSLGRPAVNDAALGLYDRWRDRADVAVHHVRGPRDYDECRTRLADAAAPGDTLGYDSSRTRTHMEVVYAEATVVVSPGGRH